MAPTRVPDQHRGMRYAQAEWLLRLARQVAATRAGLTLDEIWAIGTRSLAIDERRGQASVRPASRRPAWLLASTSRVWFLRAAAVWRVGVLRAIMVAARWFIRLAPPQSLP